jgi:hypothetical protein
VSQVISDTTAIDAQFQRPDSLNTDLHGQPPPGQAPKTAPGLVGGAIDNRSEGISDDDPVFAVRLMASLRGYEFLDDLHRVILS